MSKMRKTDGESWISGLGDYRGNLPLPSGITCSSRRPQADDLRKLRDDLASLGLPAPKTCSAGKPQEYRCFAGAAQPLMRIEDGSGLLPTVQHRDARRSIPGVGHSGGGVSFPGRYVGVPSRTQADYVPEVWAHVEDGLGPVIARILEVKMRSPFLLLTIVALLSGCTKTKSATPPEEQVAQSGVAMSATPQATGPRLDIVRDPIFAVTSDEILSYSQGWKQVLADADAQAASFSSDEMKADARARVIAKADKPHFEAEGAANLKRMQLAYLQQHPDSAFLLGYFVTWSDNELHVGFEGGFHFEERRPRLYTASDFKATVSPQELDKALTQILQLHNAEYHQFDEAEYQNLVSQAAIYDRNASAGRAKNDLYNKYIALAVVGDFRPQFAEGEGSTPEKISRETRKAYLVDGSNGAVLTELADPWSYLPKLDADGCREGVEKKGSAPGARVYCVPKDWVCGLPRAIGDRDGGCWPPDQESCARQKTWKVEDGEVACPEPEAEQVGDSQ